ncbi:MAG: DMT family transporter [Nitratireductor sp.]|nr:DMT family transporter [Nitratireductor sp.]
MHPRTFFRKFHTFPDNIKGAVYILIAAMFLVAMMMLVKLLGERLHVFQILALRQVFMSIIVAPVILRGFPGVLKTSRPDLQLLRIVFAVIAMLCSFTAVIHIPLADATAIAFAKAFFVTIFAIVILAEPVGPRRWAAVAAGFVGVVIMLRPGSEGFSHFGLLALAGAAGAGLVMVLIRLMSRTEGSTTILSWQALGVGIVMAGPAIYCWQWPTTQEWILIVLLGVVSYAGQMFNIFGYRYGEASVMASLDYVRLIYAAILGFVFFDQLPGINTWAGAAVIIAASLYTIQRERQKKQVLLRTPEGRGLN